MNDLRNFNETFRKDVTYENIKSQKKTGLQPLWKLHFWKNDSGGSNWPPAFLGLKNTDFFLIFQTCLFRNHNVNFFLAFLRWLMWRLWKNSYQVGNGGYFWKTSTRSLMTTEMVEEIFFVNTSHTGFSYLLIWWNNSHKKS